tara:strand:+ start:102 stop:407 length:306 start_codon:yes stop_codon:yes gene_type:complete
MSFKVKLDHNQIFHFHKPTGEFAIEHTQNIQPLIDSNKKLQEEDHYNRDDFRLAARIPEIVYHEWKNKYGVDMFNPDHKEGVKKLLNGHEYRYLKTTKRVI